MNVHSADLSDAFQTVLQCTQKNVVCDASRFSFNAAHDREVTIVAADACRAIGSDVMKIDTPCTVLYNTVPTKKYGALCSVEVNTYAPVLIDA